MLNAQNFSLSLNLRYGPIYRKRGKGQPELGFLHHLDLRMLSEFYLDFDPLVNIQSDPKKFGIRFGLGVLSRFFRE
jgi:hypothetical protein